MTYSNLLLLGAILYSCGATTLASRSYNVTVLNRDPVGNDSSLISRINGSSSFNYSFTTAWFQPPSGSPHSDGLIVRVVECNPNHHSCAGVDHPEWTNAGALAVISSNLTVFTTEKVTLQNVSWMGIQDPPPHGGSKGLWGLADPRISLRASTGEYFLTFDNCTENCYPRRTTLLSTSYNPFNESEWVFRGPLLGEDAPYTGGASLLLRDSPPHYAFVANSDTANVLKLATSQDGYSWILNSTTDWMSGRKGMWDESGVAAGPGVEKLSTGDYLFIYNIDTGFPYHPSYLGRCAVGWAILSSNDPSIIIARAPVPLLTSTYIWETCGGESGKGAWPLCQEPEVVFATGLKPLGNDQFLVIYGGADSVVGVAQIAGATEVHKIVKMLVFLAQSLYDYFTLARERQRPQFITISYSHYVELARWALEYSHTPFDEHGFAPGQHVLPTLSVRVAKNGSRNFSKSSVMVGTKASPTAVPTLVLVDGSVLNDSWEIAEKLSGLAPMTPELKEILDKELGTKARKYVYSVLLKPQHAATFTRMVTEGRHWAWTCLWFCGFGFVFKFLLRGSMQTSNSMEIKACKEDVEFLMSTKLAAFVNERKGKFLGGDKLGQADIALASLSSILICAEEYGGRSGTMFPFITKILASDPEFREFVTKMRATVVGEYCLKLYKEHRIPIGNSSK